MPYEPVLTRCESQTQGEVNYVENFDVFDRWIDLTQPFSGHPWVVQARKCKRTSFSYLVSIGLLPLGIARTEGCPSRETLWDTEVE